MRPRPGIGFVSLRSRTCMLVLALLALLGLGTALPAQAFTQAFFHTQSLNDRGSDVKAIQYLLRQRGYNVDADGIFGSATETAVKDFQARNGLSADGVVGPNSWGKLVVTVQKGSSGEAVKALQMQLNEKRGAGLTVDGAFGSATESAVKSFQTHAGIGADGIVGSTTWKNLIWHYERPAFGSTYNLCDYNSHANGPAANWGTASTIGLVQTAGTRFAAVGKGPLTIGDISLEHGGDIAGHATHEVGLDYDSRLVRYDQAQCSYVTTWDSSAYDRAGTRALIDAIIDSAPGHVKLIFFNDPQLQGYRGVVEAYPNHDDHLHIRYCENYHPNSNYDC